MKAIGGDNAILGAGGIATCDCCEPPPACDFPLLDVTLTWTDADITKPFLGETWTNGETKAICPSGYACLSATGTTITYGGDYDEQREAWVKTDYASGTVNAISIRKTSNGFTQYTFTNTRVHSGNLIVLRNFYRNITRTSIPLYSLIESNRLFVQYNGPTPVTTWNRYYGRSAFGGFGTYITTEVSAGTGNVGGNTPALTNFKDGITDDFEGSITSAGGLTIAWVKNNSGIQWGDCFP